MENLFFVFVIVVIAFWVGRQSKTAASAPDDGFEKSAIQSRMPESTSGTERIAMNGERAFALIFITGWIIAWSAGIFLAGMNFIATFGLHFGTLFLGGWLLAAIAGWFFAAVTIYKLATGQPVRHRDGKSI